MSRSGTTTIVESTDVGARAADRLRTSRVIWMTTVSGRGVPQTSPVWYVWMNPAVGLHLDGNSLGGDIVIVEALARIDHSLPAVPENEAYLAKYGGIMAERDWTPTWFGSRYSVPMAITPTRYRYW